MRAHTLSLSLFFFYWPYPPPKRQVGATPVAGQCPRIRSAGEGRDAANTGLPRPPRTQIHTTPQLGRPVSASPLLELVVRLDANSYNSIQHIPSQSTPTRNTMSNSRVSLAAQARLRSPHHTALLAVLRSLLLLLTAVLRSLSLSLSLSRSLSLSLCFFFYRLYSTGSTALSFFRAGYGATLSPLHCPARVGLCDRPHPLLVHT